MVTVVNTHVVVPQSMGSKHGYVYQWLDSAGGQCRPVLWCRYCVHKRNGAVLKVDKRFIYHPTRAQHINSVCTSQETQYISVV
jgi:hypothetical protein